VLVPAEDDEAADLVAVDGEEVADGDVPTVPEGTLHARRVGDVTALPSMAVKRINCVCGSVVEGDDDDELWEKAQRHLRDDHPDLAGKVARDDIVAQAEEI
jgi:hypothetical protein